MRRIRTCALGLALVAAAALLVGCGDDVTPGPPDGGWKAVDIQGAPEHGTLFGTAFFGARAFAVGVATEGLPPSAVYTPFVAEPADAGTWLRTIPSWLPADGLLTAVGFSAGGEAVIAGADLTPPGGAFLLDERGGWNRITVSQGVLAAAQSGGVIRLAGTSGVLVSDAADTWRVEPLPFPATTNERGLLDISARDGVWAACGFDDGAEGTAESPNSVVFLKPSGGAWERLAPPCAGCSSHEFRAVAVGASGGLFLGGAITHFQAGAPDDYVAFLFIRSAAGAWTEVVLPDAGGLDRVNDILIASDGTVYLACGNNGTACILRSPVGGTAACELTLTDVSLDDLAEGPGGEIYASGKRFDPGNPELVSPGLWRRAP